MSRAPAPPPACRPPRIRRSWVARAARPVFARSVAAWSLAVLVAAACAPLYLPPVPRDLLAPAPAWRVAGETTLEVIDDAAGRPATLRLRLRFDEVPSAAWVAVQWFAPVGGERASDARWLGPGDAGREIVWDAPKDLALSVGRWRAVLSVGDRLLRQLDVEVQAR